MRRTLPRCREASEYQVAPIYQMTGVPPHRTMGHLTVSLADYEWTEHGGETTVSVSEQMEPVEPEVFAQQLARAEAELEGLSDDEPWHELEPGLYQPPWDDGLEVERVFSRRGIPNLPIKGDPVAFPAARDVVLVTGSEDEAGLAALAEVAGGVILEREAWFTSVPLRRVGAAWSTWYPEDIYPDLGMFRQIRLYAWIDQYPEQQETLRERDSALRVGPYQLAEVNGEQTTISTVVRSGLTLLPKADLIEFGDDADTNAQLMRDALIEEGVQTDPDDSDEGLQAYMRLGYARWPNVVQVLGARLVPTDLWPPRYSVDGFTDDDLGQLILHQDSR